MAEPKSNPDYDPSLSFSGFTGGETVVVTGTDTLVGGVTESLAVHGIAS